MTVQYAAAMVILEALAAYPCAARIDALRDGLASVDVVAGSRRFSIHCCYEETVGVLEAGPERVIPEFRFDDPDFPAALLAFLFPGGAPCR